MDTGFGVQVGLTPAVAPTQLYVWLERAAPLMAKPFAQKKLTAVPVAPIREVTLLAAMVEMLKGTVAQLRSTIRGRGVSIRMQYSKPNTQCNPWISLEHGDEVGAGGDQMLEALENPTHEYV